MYRKYTKVKYLTEEVLKLKELGKTHREIGECFGLTKEQVKGLVKREQRNRQRIIQGFFSLSILRDTVQNQAVFFVLVSENFSAISANYFVDNSLFRFLQQSIIFSRAVITSPIFTKCFII